MVQTGAISFDAWELVGSNEPERYDLLRAIGEELVDRAEAATKQAKRA